MKQPYDDNMWKFAAIILDTKSLLSTNLSRFESRLFLPFRELERAAEEIILQLGVDCYND